MESEAGTEGGRSMAAAVHLKACEVRAEVKAGGIGAGGPEEADGRPG